MKRLFLLMMVLILGIGVLAGCGGDKGAEKPADGDGEGAALEGEYYDAGDVKALVPDGWKGFPVLDVFSEDQAPKTDSLRVIKGGEEDVDILTNPYVEILYYGPSKDMVAPMKEFYDNVEDVAPFSAGDYTWEGFKATSLDIPLIILWTADGDHEYQATIWSEMSDGKITLEDADLLNILASVAPSK